MRLSLFVGLLLIALAFWKGNGGYLDLREYLDDAERMWIKGDLRLPSEPGAPPEYNRYSLGLPFISGPFVLIGELASRITSGTVSRRAIAAFSVPVFGALVGVLLFEICLLLNFSKRIALCSALLLCLGSPHLTYTRFFNAEIGVELGILLAVWSWLKLMRDGSRPAWSLLCGVGLAIAGASHYPHAAMVGCVAACFFFGILFTSPPALSKSVIARNAILFALAPIIAATVLIALNFSRYGGLVPTGYKHEVNANIAPIYIRGNLHYVADLCMRTPWFFPALIFGGVALWKRTIPRLPPAAPTFLAAAIISGVCAQLLFWLCYYQLSMFPIRYLQPMAALAALGLPFILQWLDDRLPGRGVAYALLLLLLSNTLQFFGDTIFQPLLAAPPERGSGVWFYTWYMQPIAAGSSFEGGSPSGAIQFCVLTALLGLGVWELTHAFSIARKDASG